MSEVSITLDRAAFLPGEHVTGVLSWSLSRPARTIDVRLVWSTSGKGTQDVQVVETTSIDAAATSGQAQLSIPLPEGPYSFSGKLISLTWAIEAEARPKGGSDRREFVLSPTEREILLPTEETPK